MLTHTVQWFILGKSFKGKLISQKMQFDLRFWSEATAVFVKSKWVTQEAYGLAHPPQLSRSP